MHGLYHLMTIAFQKRGKPWDRWDNNWNIAPSTGKEKQVLLIPMPQAQAPSNVSIFTLV